MALTTTTLTSAISASRLQNIAVASTTGFAIGQPVKIDNEYMFVTAVTATAISVRMRGAEGTAAVPHDVLAAVVTSASPSDFPTAAPGTQAVIPPQWDDIVTLGQDQTISVPAKNTTYYIQKGSVAALTLNSGTAAQQGVTLTFISNTPYAHVITYAAGFRGGVNTVATFTATVGSALLTEVGIGGQIAILGSSGITLSS